MNIIKCHEEMSCKIRSVHPLPSARGGEGAVPAGKETLRQSNGREDIRLGMRKEELEEAGQKRKLEETN